uniref:3-phosphoshikimate 1-carboxyvinyltransferase n=1 Tax=Agathobacter sp. TaxID=2021311 RepID=UPI00405777AC
MITDNIYRVKKVENAHDIITEVPGSKSITNRALLIAALATGKSVLKGVLFSDDSRHFMQALKDLGFPVEIDEENKTVTVEGFGGSIPCEGASSVSEKEREEAESYAGGKPLVDGTVYVGSAGTAARFLTAFLGLSKGRYRIDASEQMKKRPMKELLTALEEIGSEIIYEEEPYHFPFIIGNFSCKKAYVLIDVEKSSQFLSALLINSVLLPENFAVRVTGNHGMSYVDMTVKMMEQFGMPLSIQKANCYHRMAAGTYQAKEYRIEPDVSAACYFYGLSPLLKVRVKVKHVHMNCLQGDIKFLKVLIRMGCSMIEEADGVSIYPPRAFLAGGSFDLSSFSDQALTLAAIAPFAASKVCIMNVGHIRYQECNRIHAILNNLMRMGVSAVVDADNIFILPGKPTACTIETYEDHRVAMAFSMPGVVTEGIKIKNPSCTRKTFENYFEVLEEAVY